MASPKSKISRATRGGRRAHSALKRNPANNCDNCGSLKMPQTVCPSCGFYKGREIVPPKS